MLKKVYVKTTAAALRGVDETIKTANNIKENCEDILAEAKEVIEGLRELGIKKVVMMTGDSEKTARAIAKRLALDEHHAKVLPEDKANYVRKEKEAGRKVLMVGDGVNDTPALSEATIGIAIGDGAAIAREIADITISSDRLESLVTLRKTSTLLMKRINTNYRFIMGFNSLLILLGVFGILPASTSALLHNGSTAVISLASMTKLKELKSFLLYNKITNRKDF